LDSAITGEEWKFFEKFLSERIKQCSTRRNPIYCDQTVDICRDVTNPMISGWSVPSLRFSMFKPLMCISTYHFAICARLAHIFGLVETGLHSEQLLLTALSDVYVIFWAYLFATLNESLIAGRVNFQLLVSDGGPDDFQESFGRSRGGVWFGMAAQVPYRS
jgi:hypothetical protein